MTFKQGLVLFFWVASYGCSTISAPMAPEMIATWLVIGKDEASPAHLRHHTSTVDLILSFDAATNFRCYSPEDDLIIRNRMSALEAIQGSGL